MKVSERWTITGGRADFVLTEHSVKKDEKTGKDKVHTKSTYHPTVEQCFNKIVWVETKRGVDDGTLDTIADLQAFLDALKTDLKEIARATEAALLADRESADATDQA